MIAPFAEDLVAGKPLPAAPAITIDEGLAAQYMAISGDQLRPTLSDPYARALTGQSTRLANPSLVIGLSIGQSTVATRRVVANLSYQNVLLERQVHIGETIETIVTPIATSWTSKGHERAKVLLNMSVSTADGGRVAEYQRLALLPVRDPDRLVATVIPALGERPLSAFVDWIPAWTPPENLDTTPLDIGVVRSDPLADTVSSARELVRMTQNLAIVHRDARAASGRRLVYGGHTIALAQASLSRMLGALLSLIGWRACSHLAPVYEEDLLSFEFRIDGVHPAGVMQLADATVWATAHRSDGEERVLEWRPILLLAAGGER